MGFCKIRAEEDGEGNTEQEEVLKVAVIQDSLQDKLASIDSKLSELCGLLSVNKLKSSWLPDKAFWHCLLQLQKLSVDLLLLAYGQSMLAKLSLSSHPDDPASSLVPGNTDAYNL